jgi:3-isopropylmalate/(R)-2-methylmalate dehydratase large subunit
VPLDRAVLNGALAPGTLQEIRHRGRPWAAERVLLTMDFLAPEVDSRIPRSRALCRELAQAFGLHHVFDLNMGVGSHVVVESALVEPGHFVVGCGRCLGVLGGIGVLALRAEEAPLAEAVVTGRFTLTVPPAIRVAVQGKLPRFAGPWDVASAVVAAVGGDALPGRVVEIEVEGGEWDLDLRLGVCGILREMGAWGALVAPDAAVGAYFRERGARVVESLPASDGAWERAAAVKARDIRAVTAERYQGPAADIPREGEPVQDVFIGSCYGGRYADLAVVTQILKQGRRVHPDVRLVISPATLATARMTLAAGFHETFLEAGAMLVVPGGGPGSAAGGSVFGDGERVGSTAEYHRHLGAGQGRPDVRILGPAAAAAAAVAGRLTDPSALVA